MPKSPCELAIAEYFSAIRAMDADRCAAVFDTNAESHDPVGAKPLVGREAIHQFFAHLNSSFKAVTLTEQNAFIRGDSAAIKWTGEATAHSGKTVAFEGIDVLHCSPEGKILTLHAYWDPAPVMAIVTS